jgi:hypothetical protein
VELDLADSGTLGAEVRWSQQGRVGLRFDGEFELRKLSRPRPGAPGLRMVTPDYLNPDLAKPRRAARSPLATKRGK